MITQSIDTNPDVERIQISLLQQASIAKRFAIMQSLTSAIMQLSKRAIARANPGLSDVELNILFVKYHFGEMLAEKFGKYLIEKTNE